MKIRTDVHRPSAINPADYEYVAFEYLKIEDLGSALFLQAEREIIRGHMARTGGRYSTHEHGGNCMVCGSVNAVYTVLFYHRPSNTYVRMGTDCAQKCEMAYSDGDANAFKMKCKTALEFAAGKKKAQATLTEKGLEAAWGLYTTEQVPNQYEELTVCDIVRKLIQYGSISEAQEKFIRNLLYKISNREEIARQREAEKAAALQVPVGRMQITGTIMKVASYDSIYGTSTKMTIKSPDGWLAFGTVPSNAECNRGDKVTFTATLEPSKDDSKFGFFKRPTKMTVQVTEPVMA